MDSKDKRFLERFEDGESGFQHRSMAIRNLDGYTAITALGNAVYAVRAPTERIIRFDGWAFTGDYHSKARTIKNVHWPLLRELDCISICPSDPNSWECKEKSMEEQLYEEADIIEDGGWFNAPTTKNAHIVADYVLERGDTNLQP